MSTLASPTTARRGLATALVLAAAGVATLAAPAVSDARCVVEINGQTQYCDDVKPQRVAATGVVGVNPKTTLGVRYVPVQNSKQWRQLRNGQKVYIVCQTRGSKVSGTYGTTRLWNKLKYGGYVSDAYVFTGKDGRVAPRCK
jgi:hypothetical protein